MSIFRNAVFLAAVAGLLAGLALAALQSFSTWPLILQAETFENAAPAEAAAAPAAHEHAAGTPEHEHPAAASSDAAAPAAAAHEHGEDEWEPSDGFQRNGFTVLASVGAAFGFALLLVMASEIAGGIASWRQGALWGLAGFAVFVLAPQLGLPPELPAMPAADVFPRQIWWWATAICTAAGLAMIVFRGTALWSLIALALIAAPHVIGAPQPVSYETSVPESLHHQFIVNTTVVNLVFWVLLGGLVGAFRDRFFGAETRLEGKFA